MVVLNQVDTVNPFAAAECADDLRRLIDEDGLRRSPVLTTSARTGAGIDALRGLLADAVTKRRARNDRLVADVEEVVEAMVGTVSAGEPAGVASAERGQLVEALATSAGVPVIGSAVEESWQLRAAGSLGWPPTRWARRLRPDPLRRLHLTGDAKREVRAALVRSSVPAPTPVQRAQVDTAVRRVCDAVAADLPEPWQRSVRAAAVGRSGDVRDRLDQAVVGTDLGVDRVPPWWRVGAAVQWLLVAAVVVGGLWLLALGYRSYLLLPDARDAGAGGHRGADPAARRRGAARPPAGCRRPAPRPWRCRRAPPPRGVTVARGDREGRRRADARPGRGRAGPARTCPVGAGAGPHRLTAAVADLETARRV